MGNQTTKVNALIDLLGKHNNDALSKMKSQYTDHKELFKGGLSLGETQTKEKGASLSVNEQFTTPVSHVYAEIAIEGLKVANQAIIPVLNDLKSRLRKAKQIRLFGQVIAAVSSAGLIGAVLIGFDKIITIVTALLNFAGVVLTFMAEAMQTPNYGGKKNLISEFEKLSADQVKAEFVLLELTRYKSLRLTDEEIMTKVREANRLASDLREAEAYIA